MLEIAKLELFCTSISAPDKNANLYHNLIISLNKASTEKKNMLGHSGLNSQCKVLSHRSRVRNLGIRHHPSLLALCLQQTSSGSAVKCCQDTRPTTDPLMVYYHYTADPRTIRVDSVQEIHITVLHNPQAVESVDVELQIQRICWLHGGSALLTSELFKGQVLLQIILKVSLNCKIQWALLNKIHEVDC